MADWSLVHRTFWRALLQGLHPRVLWLTMTPLAASLAVLGLLWWRWGAWALSTLSAQVATWPPVVWLDALTKAWLGWGAASALSHMAVLLLSLLVVVLVSLTVVSATLTPALAAWVVRQRFPQLHSLQGGTWWSALWWSASSSVLAVGWWLASVPLWLVPLGSTVLPTLVWGWLSFRVLSFDVLAEHATAAERTELLRAHRLPLLSMGVASAALGALPSQLLMWTAWGAGALGSVAAGAGVPVLGAVASVVVPMALAGSIWIYTLVFAWSSLWFANYLLEALARHRATMGHPAPAALLHGSSS
jgi:Etoposide-induced protein 2.4 (EI24)